MYREKWHTKKTYNLRTDGKKRKINFTKQKQLKNTEEKKLKNDICSR